MPINFLITNCAIVLSLCLCLTICLSVSHSLFLTFNHCAFFFTLFISFLVENVLSRQSNFFNTSVPISLYLSIYLSIYLFAYQSTYLRTYLSIYIPSSR